LGKAEQLLHQARQITPTDPGQAEMALRTWREALAAVEHAEGVRAAGLADEATRQRVAELRDELQAAVDAAQKVLAQRRKEVKFLEDLERARLPAASPQEGNWNAQASVATYVKAFADYGRDIRTSSPEAVARWLEQCPAPLVEPVLLALNNWALIEQLGEDKERLWQIVQQVDKDHWRRRFHAALLDRDPAPLRALVGLATKIARNSWARLC
jgi:hypothetical protein